MPTERNPGTGSTGLKRMILSQSMEATAIPMLLFSDATSTTPDGPAEHPDAVRQAAAGLGIDLDALALYSFDAYRLQSRLGEGLAP